MKTLTRILCVLCLPLSAWAQVPEPPSIAAKSYILYDFDSQQTLAERDALMRVEPASITKIMTAYIAFDEIKQGRITLNDQVLISEKAWRTPGSRTFVEVGKRVVLEDLLMGSIVQSGNDATVAIAEHIAGDESVFAQMMNKQAARMGMKDTHFMNSTGLPDAEHYTTAHDIAILADYLIRDFPQQYKHYYSTREFTFGHGKQISQMNRNMLLDMDPFADGIKTGHTESAGYCLAASSIREGRRIISVVMGTSGMQARATASKALLDYGFRFFENVTQFGVDKPVERVTAWKGSVSQLPVGTVAPVSISLPRGTADKLKTEYQISTQAIAPIQAGQELGTLTLSVEGKTLRTLPLVALADVAEGGLLTRAVDSLRLWWAE
ncbi:D-alanyl-D-alanine carboxypeptidase family protein [Sinimarinibacterium sp. NLF-5-8]|uniref:D-alanyl-D-alanine carboxypeptidase family protein n=1 Tax=Sinimarinibacterium sp. NLF-5-8 TaxID=2698684 RepID=UPI00137C1758|nr:D-alanyl-D-alanine carboxypeptidase family protein [Sinimarinibacterium sp. NLF-5-8]QHS10522.1 D-alanyl-D-alanine carboxypeptidase [Sinimarinibacterium sp. NLF-5-8]